MPFVPPRECRSAGGRQNNQYERISGLDYFSRDRHVEGLQDKDGI